MLISMKQIQFLTQNIPKYYLQLNFTSLEWEQLVKPWTPHELLVTHKIFICHSRYNQVKSTVCRWFNERKLEALSSAVIYGQTEKLNLKTTTFCLFVLGGGGKWAAENIGESLERRHSCSQGWFVKELCIDTTAVDTQPHSLTRRHPGLSSATAQPMSTH